MSMRKKWGWFLCLTIAHCLFLFPQNEKLQVKVVSGHGIVRQEPRPEAAVIATVPMNGILDVLEKSGSWYRIMFRKGKKDILVTGYIHESSVRLLTEDEQPAVYPSYREMEPKSSETNADNPAQNTGRFVLRLFGNLSFFSANDINKGIEGYTDLNKDTFLDRGWPIDVDGPKALKGGISPEITIIIPLVTRLGVGVGLEYFRTSKTSTITGFKTEGEAVSTLEPVIEVIPVKISLVYSFPLSAKWTLLPYAGVSFHFSKFLFTWDYIEGDFQQTTDIDASGRSLGFHGGLGCDLKLSSNIALSLEAEGKYAKIPDYEGTYEVRNNAGYWETRRGPVYFIEYTETSGKTYAGFLASQMKPSDSSILSVKQLEIDLSGIRIKAGISFRF